MRTSIAVVASSAATTISRGRDALGSGATELLGVNLSGIPGISGLAFRGLRGGIDLLVWRPGRSRFEPAIPRGLGHLEGLLSLAVLCGLPSPQSRQLRSIRRKSR